MLMKNMSVVLLLCVLLSELLVQKNQSWYLKVPPKGLLERVQIFLLFRKADKDLNQHGMLKVNFS